MPNGHGPKEYGKHEYHGDGDGRSDCKFGCGCWVSSATSGGPLGLDPFGACPGNPVDGKLLGGKADYENLVTYRIRGLESRLYKAENLLKQVAPSKTKLAEELALAGRELVEKQIFINNLQRLIEEEVKTRNG